MEGDKERKKETVEFTSVELIIILLLVIGFICPSLFGFMLRWFYGHTRRDRVRNEAIRDRVGVVPIEEKLTQHRLRWFGHVQQRPPEAPVRSGVLERVDIVKRDRGRPKLTWDESVK